MHLSVTLWLAAKKKNIRSERCCSTQKVSSCYMQHHYLPAGGKHTLKWNSSVWLSDTECTYVYFQLSATEPHTHMASTIAWTDTCET